MEYYEYKEAQGIGGILEIIDERELELAYDQDITDESKIMYPAYRDALEALIGIIRSNEIWHQKWPVPYFGTRNHGEYRNEYDMLYGYANNTLAFCASRGQGKTSAMLSFSKALGDFRSLEGVNMKHPAVLEKALGNCDFHVFPPIDPTMLTEDDTVLKLILARLFDEINKCWENQGTHGLPHQREFGRQLMSDQKFAILENFNTCLDGLPKNQGRKANNPDTEIEAIIRSKDSFNVKKNLLEIIQYFLMLKGGDLRNNFLVIQLDDTDMQLENAYSILEEVRKYLTLPNVIVLMATDLDQLFSLVVLDYKKKLKEYSEGFSIQEIAAKYIAKLVPASHAIHLPSIKKQYERNNLIIKIKRDSENNDSYSSIEEYLFALIREKTGLVFIRHDAYLHEIVPTTIRGVIQLSRLLEHMKTPETWVQSMQKLGDKLDPANRPDDLESLKDYYHSRLESLHLQLSNLARFEDFFVGDWVYSNLTPALRVFITQLYSSNIHMWDKQIIHHCYSLNGTSHSDNANIKGCISEDSNHFNYIRLIKALDTLQKNTDEDYKFVFALHTVISIQLIKATLADEIGPLENWLSKDSSHDTPPKPEFKTFIAELTGDFGKGTSKINGDGESLRIRLRDKIIALANSFFKEECYHNKVYDIIELFIMSFRITAYGESEKSLAILNENNSRMYSIDFFLYFLCNWDVQKHLFENLQNKLKVNWPNGLVSSDTEVGEIDKENFVNSYFEALEEVYKEKGVSPPNYTEFGQNNSITELYKMTNEAFIKYSAKSSDSETKHN